MKLLILFFLIASAAFAQVDQSPNVINLADNTRLQYKGSAVKMKGTVSNFTVNTVQDFTITVIVTMYVNNAGAYGVQVTQDIAADNTLSTDQQNELMSTYGDRVVTYSTSGQFTDANGNLVASTTPGAIPEIQYWQSFKINQVPGYTSASTQSALALNKLIIAAIVAKLDTRKKW